MNGPAERDAGGLATSATSATAVTAGDIPFDVQWQEGMLLAPQHFQWHARRQESLLHYHAVTLSPFHWGVSHLLIDKIQLMAGLFRVRELEAVLPDGLAVSLDDQEGATLAVDLKTRLRQGPVTVHLAVARRGSGLALADRYEFRNGTTADENTGDGEVDVPVLKPKLCLLLDDEPEARYVSFPLARVVYRDSTWSLTDFEPPWLRVAPPSNLFKRNLKLVADLHEKAGELAGQAGTFSSSARVPQLLETRSKVHALVGGLPAFEAVLRCGAAHPFQVYLALCGVLGHVSGLGQSLMPPALKPYDHNDLTATFEPLWTAVEEAVSQGTQEAYTVHRFILKDGGWRLPFNPDWMQRSLILGVRAPWNVADSEMAAWVTASLIAARPKIEGLRVVRARGAQRKAIGADGDLVPSVGVSLYGLTADENVTPGEELEIRNLEDREGRPRPEEILLYVRKRA